MFALLSFLGIWVAACAPTVSNMNGLYQIMNSADNKYSTDFSKRQNVEYFDVYSPPITTQYGEVFWTMMDAVPLPDAIVQRFQNQTIAIVGYEADQVAQGPNGEDISVPINHQYNHHYGAYIQGKNAELVKMKRQKHNPKSFGMMDHGGHEFWMAKTIKDDPNPNSFIPTAQFFSEANGGEYRKSYHGYPEGYAQLIESPVVFHIQPMQIDTHNRDWNGTEFKAGPLPKAAKSPSDAEYSGLLECPCTDRIEKKWATEYILQTNGSCSTVVVTAAECAVAAVSASVFANLTTPTILRDSTRTPGCFVVRPSGESAQPELFFNDVVSNVTCGSGALKSSGTASIAESKVTVTVDLDGTSKTAVITMVGSATVWYAVAFDATMMGDLPYTIVVNGSGSVWEQKLGDHDPGSTLTSSITVVNNSVVAGVRTVVVSRAMAALTKDHYAFSLNTLSIKILSAVGSGGTYAYHAGRGGAVLSMIPIGTPLCLCNNGVHGTINGIGFSRDCWDVPYGDLLHEKNPTCFVEDYVGGLLCCFHKNLLLDKDQNVWADRKDTYRLKFRFWFQTYDPVKNYPQNLVRFYQQTEANAGEYDVTQCSPTTPPQECVHTITAHFQVNQTVYGCDIRSSPHCSGNDLNSTGMYLIYAAPHCHAPACLSMELFNADTGDLICGMGPVYGQGQVDNDKYDEKGYLAIPPCIWGHEDGLYPPPYLSWGTNLMAIKRNNNSYYHFGEMASWQMRGVIASL